MISTATTTQATSSAARVPRGARSTAAILAATYELLGQVGYPALSIEAVAAKASASKATIYRRWPDKRSLVIATVLAHAGPAHQSDQAGLSLREDLIALMVELRQKAEFESLAVFTALLSAAQTDDVLATLMRGPAVEYHRQKCTGIVERAVARGELRDPGLASELFDLAFGRLLVHQLLGAHPTDTANEVRFVDAVLVPALKASDTVR